MMKLLIPVGNLLLVTAVKLGEVILIPYYGLGQDLTFDPEIPRETREEIRGFSIANPGFIERLRVGGMTCLAWLDPGGSDGPEALGASAPREPSGEAVNSAVLAAGLEKVERALDYIRVQCCRFDRPEFLPGRAGVLGEYRRGFLWRAGVRQPEDLMGPACYFYLQPGIGLEVDLESPKRQDPALYQLLFSERRDKAYLFYRSIIAKACQAFHRGSHDRAFALLHPLAEGLIFPEEGRVESFKERRPAVAAFISDSQREYAEQSDFLFLVFKTLRTETTHHGKSLYELLSAEEVPRVLSRLFDLIIRFAAKAIETGRSGLEDIRGLAEKAALAYEKEAPKPREICPAFEDEEPNQALFFVPIAGLRGAVEVGGAFIGYCPELAGFDRLADAAELLSRFMSRELAVELLLDNPEITLFFREPLIIFRGDYPRGLPKPLEGADRLLEGIYPRAFPYSPLLASFGAMEGLLEVICRGAQRKLDIFALSAGGLEDRGRLPAAAGVIDGIRRAELLDLGQGRVFSLTGKVHQLYRPAGGFPLPERPVNIALLEVLAGERRDEVYLCCREALARMAEALYFDDDSFTVACAFDTLDMLDGAGHNEGRLRTHLASFLASGPGEYQAISGRLRELGRRYRNPMTHRGKSLWELTSSPDERSRLFSELKETVMEYCVNVIRLGITSFSDLEEERKKRTSLLTGRAVERGRS